MRRSEPDREVVVIVAKRTLWLAVATGAAALGGLAVSAGLNRAWKLALDEEPPLDPASWDVEWRDAILWTLATGVVMGMGRLLARRGAAAGWQRFMGEKPPY